MIDLITFGETLVVGRAEPAGPLRHAELLRLDIAGAESNVAIGLRRLGHPVAWVGRVGANEFGDRVLATLRAEHIDISGAIVDPSAPTAFMIKERRTGAVTRVAYYRTGSAGSRLSPEDIDPKQIAVARILHVTGITAALSPDALTALHTAIDIARHTDSLVSIDVNYRSQLWPDRSDATATLTALTRRADIVFASQDERDLVGGSPAQLVVTRGSAGAVCFNGNATFEQTAFAVDTVDTVGAGDAFVAGYLSGALDDLAPAERLRRGAILGSFAVTSHSDWQALPTRPELDLIDADAGSTVR